MINVSVNGALGRMGSTVCGAVLADPETDLVDSVDYNSKGNQTLNNKTIHSSYEYLSSENKPDVIVDFTNRDGLLDLAKKASLENDSKLFFVYLPEISRYKNQDYENILFMEIKKVVEESGIPFIDIDKKVFKKEDEPLKLFPFKTFNHYTIEGYNKISKSIFKFVSK